MHEVSQRWAVTMAVISAVVGVVALVLGAFFAPLPTHAVDANGNALVTAVFIRGFLALLALAAAFVFAYYAGYKIQDAFEPTPPSAERSIDAGSAIFSLFSTPGPRRDALYAGGITLASYWLFTALYIAALGRFGNVGDTSGGWGAFIVERLLQGVALIAGGGGAGALGARNALTRRLTKRIFSAPAPEATTQAPQSETAPDNQNR